MTPRAGLLTALLLGAGAATSTAGDGLGEPALERVAQTRACYLGIFDLYDAEYLRAESPTSGATRCVRLSYLRGFSAEQLDEATAKVFGDRHGEDVAGRYRDQLLRLGAAYRAVDSGDSYTFCVVPQHGGVLRRDGQEVLRLGPADLAERVMQIWVRGEDASANPQWAFGEC